MGFSLKGGGALLAVAAAAGLAAVPAFAQNANLNPTYGSTQLTNNFAPDPFQAQLRAGGNIDAGTLQPRYGFCGGFIANEPDYELTYNAGDFPLILRSVSNADTTLVVRGPDGAFYCDDDSGGNLNPQVAIERPQSGTYDIWVGTFEAGTTYPEATLEISELVENKPNGFEPFRGDLGSGQFTQSVFAGGFFLATQREGAQACAGFVSLFPDAEITGGGGAMQFAVRSGADTTLAVRAPDGTWFCDDDSGGDLNPALSIPNGASGTYQVWVGTFGGGNDFPAAQLTVTGSGGGGGGGATPPNGGGTGGGGTGGGGATPGGGGDGCDKKVC